MRPVVLIKSLVAAVANNIAQAQALAAAGNLVLNGATVAGGIATLDSQRRVLLTSGGNDSALTFTVYGAGDNGAAITEAVAGANAGTAVTLQDFRTVTRVSSSGAVATTIAVGTNGVGSTPWMVPSNSTDYPSIGIQADILSGAATFSIETTGVDPKAPISIYQQGYSTTLPVPVPYPVAGLTGLVAGAQGNISAPVAGWRLTITAGTGQVQAVGIQAGLGSP